MLQIATMRSDKREIELFWPRLRSRPKFASDQTFQTKIISDQTFQTEITSDQTFQTEIISDQTFQIKWVLIRLSRPKDFWSDHLQTMVQTQFQTIAQTLIKLWSDPISEQSSLWSDSVETISSADHSDQKHSKSPSSALPSFNHNTLIIHSPPPIDLNSPLISLLLNPNPIAWPPPTTHTHTHTHTTRHRQTQTNRHRQTGYPINAHTKLAHTLVKICDDFE